MSRYNSYDPLSDVYKFKTRNAELGNLFRGLCESLGIVTREDAMYEHRTAKEISFRSELDLGFVTKPKPGRVRFRRRFIMSIEEVEPMPCVHIETDGTFLAGAGFIAVC